MRDISALFGNHSPVQGYIRKQEVDWCGKKEKEKEENSQKKEEVILSHGPCPSLVRGRIGTRALFAGVGMGGVE